MPLVTGPITLHGAIVDVFVGESDAKKLLLAKLGLPIPEPVHVQAIIDTGAMISRICSSAIRIAEDESNGKGRDNDTIDTREQAI